MRMRQPAWWLLQMQTRAPHNSSVLDGLLELSWPAVSRTRSGSGLDSLCRGSSAVWSALLMFRD